MSLASFSIKRSLTTTVIFIAIIGFGLFSLLRLKLDLYPDISFPVVVVMTNYTGAGPKDVENLITKTIEGAVSSVEDVEEVRSVSAYGNSIVYVKFGWGTDMDKAERQVQKYLDMYAKPLLPDGVDDPFAFAFDPALQPVVFFSVKGNGKNLAELRKVSEDVLEPMIERIEGVAHAFTMGGLRRQINIKLNPARMKAFGVSIPQFLSAVKAANMLIPGGTLDSAQVSYNIMVKGDFTSVTEIKKVILGLRDNKMITIGDVAQVEDGFKEEDSVSRHEGKDAVLLLVRKQSDANTVRTVDNIMASVDKLKKKNLFPKGIELRTFWTQAEIIKLSLGNLSSTAWQALIITIIVLLLFTASFRSSFAVGISIPVSVMATFAVMDQAGITLNVISMAGLALAIGMLVDTSIVVSENVFRLIKKEGNDVKTAAIEGTHEVKNAIMASTTTTIVVFAPVLFVPGIAGQLFKDMSLTICFSLAISLLVAMTLTPMLNAQLFKFRGGITQKGKILSYFPNLVEKFTDKYEKILAFCMKRRKKTLILAAAIFVASILFGAIFIDVDFFAHGDESFILLNVDAKPGITLNEFEGIFNEVEAITKKSIPEIEQETVNFGATEGFANLIGQSTNSGFMRIKLVPISKRKRTQGEIEKKLTSDLSGVAGVEIRASRFDFSGNEGDMEIKIFNEDIDILSSFGKGLTNKLRSVEGVGSIKFSLAQGQPELNVKMKREKMKVLGITPAEVTQTISTYMQGTLTGVFRESGDEYDIVVRAEKKFRNDEKYLKNMPITLPTGDVLPLYAMANITEEDAPLNINRFNQKRLATIVINKDENIAMGTMVNNVNEALASYPTPTDVQIAIGGSAEDMQESFKWLAIAFLVSILLVYMVMVAQYETLFEPFVILFTIPLSIVGVLIALVLTGTTLQITAMIGVIMLVGIVVNNAIVLVDYLKQLRDRGLNLEEASIQAGRTRLRPVLMTTLTTILGMSPLALKIGEGAESWSPMAITVIGGLTISTALTLIIIPVTYVSFVNFFSRLKKLI